MNANQNGTSQLEIDTSPRPLPERGGEGGALGPSRAGQWEGLLTRVELALALKVSLRTVDMMLADGDITPVRLRGKLVRFYLPDVLQELREKAKTSKRNVARKL